MTTHNFLFKEQKISGSIDRSCDIMKKHLYIIICIIFCFLTACSLQPSINNSIVTNPSENYKIIDSCEYYRIYKINTTQVYYEIYNSNGDIALSETTDKPLTIDMINNDVVDIGIGMGTGLTTHKYYSIKQNLFSQEFLYVLSNSNELIAYIDVPKHKSFENRKVIVQNIFDKELYHKEFQLDFSDVDTPVIQGSFSEDEKSLQITYFSGKDEIEISEILELF